MKVVNSKSKSRFIMFLDPWHPLCGTPVSEDFLRELGFDVVKLFEEAKEESGIFDNLDFGVDPKEFFKKVL